MSEFGFPEAVVIQSKHHATVAGLSPAIRWGNTGEGTRPFFHWFEAGHARAVQVHLIIENSAGRLRFKTAGEQPDLFEVLPMTLERYRLHVKPRTVGKPDFRSLDELLEAMRREW